MQKTYNLRRIWNVFKTGDKVGAKRTEVVVKEINANKEKSWGLHTGKIGKVQKRYS